MKSWTAPAVLDTEALGYRYDTILRPTFNPVPPPPAGGDIQPFGLDQPDFTPLAASSQVQLSGARTVNITGGDGEGAVVGVDPDSRWVVRLDGIRCRRPAVTAYAVYLDLDDEGTPEPSRLLGAVSLFGVFESSIAANGEMGSTRVVDATSVVHGIPGFDPLSARLTLIPTRGDRDLEAMGLVVDRISLEVG